MSSNDKHGPTLKEIGADLSGEQTGVVVMVLSAFGPADMTVEPSRRTVPYFRAHFVGRLLGEAVASSGLSASGVESALEALREIHNARVEYEAEQLP